MEVGIYGRPKTLVHQCPQVGTRCTTELMRTRTKLCDLLISEHISRAQGIDISTWFVYCHKLRLTYHLSLLLYRASCRFTKYHTTNKCTNCMSFILNHFFKTLFIAPTCFDSISLIIIREHI